MSHKVQVVELSGIYCRDKTLEGCGVPSCARLCNMFLQQNQPSSQSQSTTRTLCALALGKNNVVAINSWGCFDWDRKRTLIIIVLMMLMDEEEPFWWNEESSAVDN